MEVAICVLYTWDLFNVDKSAKMKEKLQEQTMLPEEVIIRKIYFIRGKKVMFDRDLADLYKVDTKQLKRAVRRNIDRFPADFMFELSSEELSNWRSQFGTSNCHEDTKTPRFTKSLSLMTYSSCNFVPWCLGGKNYISLIS